LWFSFAIFILSWMLLSIATLIWTNLVDGVIINSIFIDKFLYWSFIFSIMHVFMSFREGLCRYIWSDELIIFLIYLFALRNLFAN
jgi:hypothetical protein